MAKVLVTGGTGFVGYWMQRTQPPGLECTYIGAAGYESMKWGLGRWGYIAHLANVSPALVIEVARRDRARLLYASSGIVYHPEIGTEYRLNKDRWEREAMGAGAVSARLFTFFGERLDDGKAVTQFVKLALAGEPLRIWGDGNAVRSYMHGATMGRLLWAILLRGVAGEAYDVGSDKPVTILELARMVKAAFPKCPGIYIENSRPDPVPYYMPVDTAKTRRLLRD